MEFFEEDEPIEKIVSAFEDGEKGLTAPPETPVCEPDPQSSWLMTGRTSVDVQPSGPTNYLLFSPPVFVDPSPERRENRAALQG